MTDANYHQRCGKTFRGNLSIQLPKHVHDFIDQCFDKYGEGLIVQPYGGVDQFHTLGNDVYAIAGEIPREKAGRLTVQRRMVWETGRSEQWVLTIDLFNDPLKHTYTIDQWWMHVLDEGLTQTK